MKIFYCFIAIISLTFSFSGCTGKRPLQTTKIITACSACADGEYTFFVAAPKGSSEDGGSQIKHTSYFFTASNFLEAVEKMKNSADNIDLSHISIFLADNSYISNKFSSDAQYIRQKIKISPLIKVFVSQNSATDVVDSITSNYADSFEKYIDAAFAKNKKKVLCTMSEMFFAKLNPYYTASIPVVSISPENSLPQTSSALLYNIEKGTQLVEDEDYSTYESTVKTYGKSSDLFDLSYRDNALFVAFNKNFSQSDKVSLLAKKYQKLGFDIFNSLYFSKKCFPTYSSYEKSIGSISVSDIVFKKESK